MAQRTILTTEDDEFWLMNTDAMMKQDTQPLFLSYIQPLFLSYIERILQRNQLRFIQDLTGGREVKVNYLKQLDADGKEKLRNALDKLFTKRDDGSRDWQAFLDLGITERIERRSKSLSPSSSIGAIAFGDSQATEKSWNSQYQGDIPELLWKHIQYYRTSSGTDLYANMCAIVQSSGTGKSRAVDELGKNHFVIPVNLRNVDTGYPPADAEVREYLTNVSSMDIARGRCIAFLHGLFLTTRDVLLEVIKENPNADRSFLITRFHDLSQKAQFRETFFSTVRRTAEENEMAISKPSAEPARLDVAVSQSRSEKPPSEHDLMQKCRISAEDLVNVLRRDARMVRRSQSEEIEVIIAFDEAHTLCETRGDTAAGEKPWSVFVALRDALRGLFHTATWGLFLSTTGKLSQFNPHRGVDPSVRIRNETFVTVPPFTTFRYDLFAPPLAITLDGHFKMLRQFNNLSGSPPVAKKMRLEEYEDLTLETVTSTPFLVRFGRPLFALLYEHGNQLVKDTILHYAMTKLICEDVRKFLTYDKVPPQTAFACLAQRLCLEFNSTSYNTDEETQIAAHMRLCLKIAPGSQFIVSSAGSEPLLAEAAAMLMLSENFKPAESLKHVLNGFSINKGDRGELVGMLAVTLARDFALRGRLERMGLLDKALKGTLPSDREQESSFRAVTVVEFLDKLFKLDNHTKKELEKDFSNACVYFNHFVRPLDQSTCKLHFLLRYLTRGAAILCANNQPGIDLIIGILFRSENGYILRIGMSSAIFIQIKNDQSITYEKDAEGINAGIAASAYEQMKQSNARYPIVRLTFSHGSPPDFKYKRTIVAFPDASTVVSHDFWCGGIGPHFLPERSENDETWKSLVSSTMKIKQLFADDVVDKGKFDLHRKSVAPGATSSNDFWQWFKF